MKDKKMDGNLASDNENEEVIAKKRVWTYPVIIFELLFGFLMFFSAILSPFLNKESFEIETFIIILIIGFLFFSVSLYFFISKIMTPKNIIVYNNNQKTLKITAFRIKTEVFISEIKSVFNMQMDMGIQIKFYDKKQLLIRGISKSDKVCQRIRDLQLRNLQKFN